MVDRDRVLAKLDELRGYLADIRTIVPARFEDYRRVETRRACERLIQLSLEVVLDVCALLVTGLRLGVPAEEDDLVGKLVQHAVIRAETGATLRRMKGMRNLLVHEYGRIDDRTVFETASERLGDFETFAREILAHLERSRA